MKKPLTFLFLSLAHAVLATPILLSEDGTPRCQIDTGQSEEGALKHLKVCDKGDFLYARTVLEEEIQQAGVPQSSVIISMAAFNAILSCGAGAIDENHPSFFSGVPIGGVFSLLAFRELLLLTGQHITGGGVLASGLLGFGTQIPVALGTYHACKKGVGILREFLRSKVH